MEKNFLSQLELVIVGNNTPFEFLSPLYPRLETCESVAALVEKQQNKKNKIILVNLPELTAIKNALSTLLEQGFINHQIIVSLDSVLFQEKNIFHNLQISYILQNSTPESYSILFWQKWHSIANEKLNYEIHNATAYGALELVHQAVGLNQLASMERARLAFSIACTFSPDLFFIEKTTRLALFYNLKNMQNYQQVVKNSRELWALESHLQQAEKISAPWLAEISPELLIVETCELLLKNYTKGEAEYRQILKDASINLPFKLRTTLRQTVDLCFKHVWGQKHEAA